MAKSTKTARAARSTSSGRKAAKKKPTPAKARYPQVVLRKVVRIFDEVAAETIKACRQPRSAMATHLVCMRAAGWKQVSYGELMTISGFGISFCYERGRKFWASWAPPPGADERISRATGFGWRWLNFNSPDRAWRLIKRTLNERKPLRAPCDEELVIAGFQDARKHADRKLLVLCVPFAHPGPWWTWAQFEAFFADRRGFSCAYHVGRVDKAPRGEVAREVITNIVQWAQHHPMLDNKVYAPAEFGVAAIEAYAADVENTELPPEEFAPGWIGCNAIYPQWTARKCTGDYLKAVAGEFPARSAARIRAAAKEYALAHKAWRKWEVHLGAKAKDREAAWRSAKARQGGAAAIREAIEHEKAAIIELAMALAAMGSG